MLLLEEEKKYLIQTLRFKGISDQKLLDAIYKVPREKFIPQPFRKYAYDDNALPIECKQTISQPYTVAFMTMMLEVKKGNRALEIGTGSGYQAAILCELGAEVYTIERIEHLSKCAELLLKKLHYTVHFKVGDGTTGWKENAPFDRIIVTAGSPTIPKTLVEQLATGGKMVIPIGSRDSQRLYIITKTEEGLQHKIRDSFRFVPLIGTEGWEEK
jgi:protein-L-isoaspartate(D-aspartate) O-methyltransferase